MNVSGVLVIDKPMGKTSHDVVNRVRRTLGTKKVGHAGTLDPDATGVLVLCVGDATRLLEYVQAEEKEYVAEVTFGTATDTDDASGTTVASGSATDLTRKTVEEALNSFIGGYMQQVPVYSAVHIAGRRAYDLARQGETVEMPIRRVGISSITLTEFAPGDTAQGTIVVECSKGTYIRALCRDLGSAVGIPAHMSGLCRTRSGRFTLDGAIPLSVFESHPNPASVLLPAVEAVRGMTTVAIPDASLAKLAMGQTVLLAEQPGLSGAIAVLNERRDVLAAIAQADVCEGGTRLLPKKVFWKREGN